MWCKRANMWCRPSPTPNRRVSPFFFCFSNSCNHDNVAFLIRTNAQAVLNSEIGRGLTLGRPDGGVMILCMVSRLPLKAGSRLTRLANTPRHMWLWRPTVAC